MPIKASVTAAGSGATHASANSVAVPLNLYTEPFDASFAVVLTTTTFVSGSFARVEHTFTDPTANTTWFDNSSVSGATTNVDGSYTEPVVAIRLALRGTKASVASVSGQSGTMHVLQTGY